MSKRAHSGLRVRNYHLSYKSALTISNDYGYLTFNATLELLRYLNSPELDKGISLKIPETTKKATLLTPDNQSIQLILSKDKNGSWANVPLERLEQPDWLNIAKECGFELQSEIIITEMDGSKPVSLVAPLPMSQQKNL